jgi:hypothetical protein
MDLKILTKENARMFNNNVVYSVYLLQVGDKKLHIVKCLKDLYSLPIGSLQHLTEKVSNCSLSNPMRIDDGDGMRLSALVNMFEAGAIFGIAPYEGSPKIEVVLEPKLDKEYKEDDPHVTKAGVMVYRDFDDISNDLFKF